MLRVKVFLIFFLTFYKTANTFSVKDEKYTDRATYIGSSSLKSFVFLLLALSFVYQCMLTDKSM